MQNPASQNQQLADYIKKNLSKGYTPDSLKFALINQGYSRTSVEKSIELANKQLASSAPKMSEKPTVTYQVLDDEEMRRKIAEQESQGRGFFSRLWHGIFG